MSCKVVKMYIVSSLIAMLNYLMSVNNKHHFTEYIRKARTLDDHDFLTIRPTVFILY